MAALAATLSSKTDNAEKLGASEPHLVRTLRGHRGGVTSVAFSSSKRMIASAGMDACVMLWQFGNDNSRPGKRPTRAFRFAGHRGPVYCVTLSPDGTQVASGSADRCVRLWETSARATSVEIRGHCGAVRSVDFSPDGGSLMTASDDKTVKIWALPSRKFSCTLGGGDDSPKRRAASAHTNWVRCAKWSPDGRVAASCGDDRLVKLWDVDARRCARTFFDHEAPVTCLAFSPDGTCVVSAGEDKAINVWDARSYGLLQHYSMARAVNSVAFDASGRYLAATDAAADTKLYDLRHGHLLYTLKGHRGSVTCAAFSRHGQKDVLATGGADRVIMLWTAKLDGCVELPVTNEATPKLDASGGLQLVVDDCADDAKQQEPDDDANAGALVDAAPASTSRVVPNLAQLTRRSDELPEAVAATLDHIVGQLSVVTATLGMLEERLTITENRVAALAFAAPPAPVPPTTTTTQPLEEEEKL